MAEPSDLPSPVENPFSSEDNSNNSSAVPSRPGSVSIRKPKPQHKVKFSVGANNDDEDATPGSAAASDPPRRVVPQIRMPSPPIDEEVDVASISDVTLKAPDWSGRTSAAALHAQERASRLASRVSHSAPGSRRNSVESARYLPKMYPLVSPNSSPPQQPLQYPVNFNDIPLVDMINQKDRRPYSLYEDSTDEDSDVAGAADAVPLRKADHPSNEAHRLVRSMTQKFNLTRHDDQARSGTATPAIDKKLHDLDYVPPPSEYKAGVLSSLLRLYDQSGAGAAVQRQSISGPSYEPRAKRVPRDIHDANGKYRSLSDTPGSSGHSSGKVTPQKKAKWYDKERQERHDRHERSGYGSPYGSRSQSTTSLAHLLESSFAGAAPGMPSAVPKRPAMPRSKSSGMIATAVGKITHPAEAIKSFTKPRLEDEIRITVHIAEVLARQRYLIKLCRALMIYGAPTHRLEEYMRTSARVLQIEGQFLYLPGCMLVSFDDPDTHTTEVKLVKEIQGVDLGKFKDTFTVYKNVFHDVWGVEEATKELEAIMSRGNKFPIWFRICVYGMASVSVGPFAFSARPIDFPIAFLLGAILGTLQLVIAPKSEQFQHVFEVAAAVITSFLARAFGSIRHNGDYLFCFSALAQSSIALILPGYIILCASLELQSRNIVAGSVRMVYAIIYALFLGFGITIGTALFGLMDSSAVDRVTCTIPDYWQNTYLSHWPFVPIFTLCLIIINQAKWHQAPAMLIIAFAGYQTNFWSSIRLSNNIQVADALGAFVVGALANLYSRFWHGLAAAAMLPAIFVQVPSGLAASGSLVAGLTSAEQITGNVTGITVISNGTEGFYNAQNASASASSVYGGTIFNVGYGMVQVAIGISVGLFLSALVVYPVGKKRSGLFSF